MTRQSPPIVPERGVPLTAETVVVPVELKPCPFCGGKAASRMISPGINTSDDFEAISCSGCGAMISDGTPEEWNRRAAPAREPEGGAALALGTPVEVEFSEAEVGKQTLYVAGVDMSAPGMSEPEYWLSETWPVKCRGDVSTDWKRDMFAALTPKEAPAARPELAPRTEDLKGIKAAMLVEESPAATGAGEREEIARMIRDAVGHFRMSESMAEIAADAALRARSSAPEARDAS